MLLGKILSVVFYFLRRMGFTICLKRRNAEEYKSNNLFNKAVNNFIYCLLLTDKVRNRAYENSINRNVTNASSVLEIGTGNQAFLARITQKKHPKLITAVEENKESFEQASRIVQRESLRNIRIVNANVCEMESGEKHDILIQDIIGSIGSSEGAASAIAHAKQKLLKENCKFIPDSCVTHIVPVSPLKLDLLDRAFSAWITRSDSQEAGFYRVYTYPPRLFLSASQVFEDLAFARPFNVKEERELNFAMERKGEFDGFVFFIEMNFDNIDIVNSLTHITNWSTPYIKVFQDPISVDCGDIINVIALKDLSTVEPCYRIKVKLKTAQKEYFGAFEWTAGSRWATT